MAIRGILLIWVSGTQEWSQYGSVKRQALLSTEKVSGFRLPPDPLCIGFFDGNLALVFLTTRGLLLPSGGGICSSRISLTSQVKKKEFLLAGGAEISEQPDALHYSRL